MVLFGACSTKKNKWYNRAYHTTVAHYNAYWNGNAAFKEGMKMVEDRQKDDYSLLLDVFKFPSQETSALIKPNMDRAIEKSSKVIKKHSMIFDKRERNPEIKKAYLLIGKASLYKRDYKVAQATFRHIISFWKNDDIMYEAMIWQAVTSTMEKDYSLAESYLDQVKNSIQSNKAPKKLNRFLYCVYAENALKQKKYGKALEYIQIAKEYSHSRKLTTRLMFIEAQLLQQAGELSLASRLYGKVAQRAKSYDMTFASQLRQATCYDPKKGDGKKIISKLEKMSKQEKNQLYNDQIYYALGEIYYKDKNVDKACNYWEKSVNVSTQNENQKIASSLRLANVNYDILEKYIPAHDYYDTALNVMKKDHPLYNEVKTKQLVLDNLVINLRIIQRWDSLLYLGSLSEKELDEKIEGWIEKYKKEQEEKQKQEALQRALLAQNTRNNNQFDQFRQQSSWYFYNNSTVQAGKTEFMRIWGQRKYEEYWRLTDKQQSFDFSDMDIDSTNIENEGDSLDEKGNPILKTDTPTNNNPLSKTYYTKDIPRTQGAKDTANEEISKAMLEAGYIFYQGLQNYGKAIEMLLELQKRYPSYPTTLPSSYHLYCIYEKIGQTPNANYYKNIILNNYPESEFAMMIKNPNYWEELKENGSKAEQLYKDVYQTFSDKDYNLTIQKAKSAIDTIKLGAYIPKLLYLEAISKGKLFGMDSLMSNLNMIVYNYPSSEITPTIESQLKYLSQNYNLASNNLNHKEDLANNNEETSKEKEGERDEKKEKINEVIINNVDDDDILDAESLIYRYRNMNHFYVILFDDSKLNASEMKIRYSNFNSKYYKAENLKLTSLLFTLSQQMITVDQFETIDKAMEYYNAVISTNEVLNGIDATLYKHFIISSQNYPTFYKRKNIPAYMKFFRIFYLKPLEEKKENQ
jgi:tetratricopeptide (TPR) repeat protein